MSYPGSPYQQRTPTVVPAHPFNPREDAEILRRAMKGFGTDEMGIIRVLTARTNEQRLQIAEHFQSLYGRDLMTDLKSELSGNLKKLIVAMMTPLTEYYAKELHDAMSGLGTDEDVLIDVLCTMSNAEIINISQAYNSIYNTNLDDDLDGDTSGSFRRLLISLCRGSRDESMVTNVQEAQADVEQLLSYRSILFGMSDAVFTKVLCQRNYLQLQLIFQEYQRTTGVDIEETINKEFSGNCRTGYLALIRAIKNQRAYYASRIHKSLSGMGTDNHTLIRILVTRSEIDLGDIKSEYESQYGVSMEEAIRSETSGDYRRGLCYLMG